MELLKKPNSTIKSNQFVKSKNLTNLIAFVPKKNIELFMQ